MTTASWNIWNLTPALSIGTLLALVVYVNGLFRRRTTAAPVSAWRHVVYVAGVLSVFLALQSPIESLSDHFFFMHQIEHLLLRMVAPFLLALAAPLPIFLRGLPRFIRHWLVRPVARNHIMRALYAVLIQPAVATLLFVGLLFLWELPALHDTALRDEPLHDLMHFTMLLSGLFFWWLVLDPRPKHARLTFGWKLLLLWAATVPNSVLGAFITFHHRVLYTPYDQMHGLWGVTALVDQQLGGLILWLPGDMMMVLAFFIIFSRWLQQEQSEATRPPPVAAAS
ncbi:MAG: cytochrome c oxidase assembly protein [Gammaproteobacteria bacterium]